MAFSNPLDQYINYSLEIWSQKGNDFTQEEVLATHACNQSDRNLLSQNMDYVDTKQLENVWPLLMCLDNPEKIVLGNSKNNEATKTFFIEARYCVGQDNCKSEEEIE